MKQPAAPVFLFTTIHERHVQVKGTGVALRENKTEGAAFNLGASGVGLPGDGSTPYAATVSHKGRGNEIHHRRESGWARDGCGFS